MQRACGHDMTWLIAPGRSPEYRTHLSPQPSMWGCQMCPFLWRRSANIRLLLPVYVKCQLANHVIWSREWRSDKHAVFLCVALLKRNLPIWFSFFVAAVGTTRWNVLTHQVSSAIGHFWPMIKVHVPTWTVSIYTVHGTIFPRGSACVYIVHVLNNVYQNDHKCGWFVTYIPDCRSFIVRN